MRVAPREATRHRPENIALALRDLRELKPARCPRNTDAEQPPLRSGDERRTAVVGPAEEYGSGPSGGSLFSRAACTAQLSSTYRIACNASRGDTSTSPLAAPAVPPAAPDPDPRPGSIVGDAHDAGDLTMTENRPAPTHSKENPRSIGDVVGFLSAYLVQLCESVTVPPRVEICPEEDSSGGRKAKLQIERPGELFDGARVFAITSLGLSACTIERASSSSIRKTLRSSRSYVCDHRW